MEKFLGENHKLILSLIEKYYDFQIAISQKDFSIITNLHSCERLYNDLYTEPGYFIHQYKGLPWTTTPRGDTLSYVRYKIENMEIILHKARKLGNFK